ncbi:TetR-like C-terminal domain-containing protein [Amorphus coralli]|uniref:TetR-like C-terminal domain-containing protein n=1 Tax=Amorphus coralli TaxID=340680 RepID=UPI0009FDCB13|nr:TetR-like C-terminal domain-containing protein [Amorphus coralli]
MGNRYRQLCLEERCLLACQAEGYLPDRDPDTLAFTLWSTVHGAASLIAQNRVPSTTDRAHLVTTIIDTVMDLVAATR